MQTDCPALGIDWPPGPSYTFMDYMGISGDDEMLAYHPLWLYLFVLVI
jgi:hypothetical protein